MDTTVDSTPNETLERLGLPRQSVGNLWLLSSLERRAHRHMHRHVEWEFNLTIAGKASYLLRDRRSGVIRRYFMRRGTLLFLFPEQDHVLIEPDDEFAMWIAVFTPELTTNVAASLLNGEALATVLLPRKVGGWLSETETRRFERLLTDVAKDNEREPLNRGLKYTAFAYLLARAWSLYCSADELPCGPLIHPSIAKAARLLEDETEPMSIEVLGRQVGLSASRLSRLFHAQTGETIAEFRNRQRIERFFALSNESEKTLLSRAQAAGFGSYAQFHRVFRKIMGRSPSHAR